MGGHFLRRPLGGGGPPLFLFCFPPKVATLANLKCQKGSRIIGTVEHGVVSDSSARGANLAPPPFVGERVKVNTKLVEVLEVIVDKTKKCILS